VAKITFTNGSNIGEDFFPKPASSYIPEWYKKTESYVDGEKKPNGYGAMTATIKKCMPVFDAISAGYIITTYVDIFVSQVDATDENGNKTGKTVPWYEWPSDNPIEWHPVTQAPNHPRKRDLPNNTLYPKWINPWAIATPPGYSVLVTAPMHNESVFTILDGIVDTDRYTSQINFPFVLNDWSFEGLIPAGTPMAQIIPFKRESWKMEIGNDDDLALANSQYKRLRTKFFDSYKTLYRQNKEYK
jgi:hypothetical protein